MKAIFLVKAFLLLEQLIVSSTKIEATTCASVPKKRVVFLNYFRASKTMYTDTLKQKRSTDN